MPSNHNSKIKKFSVDQLRTIHSKIIEIDRFSLMQGQIVWLILCNIRLTGKFDTDMIHIAKSVGIIVPNATRDVKRMIEGKFIGSEVLTHYESGGEYESSYFIKEIP